MLSITPDPTRRGGFLLQAETIVRRQLSEVFPFFADALNLEQITPPWLHFQVMTPPPIEMYSGQLIDYRLRIHGVPVRWRTEIAAWEPPYMFADHQLRGPYRYWQHEHFFEECDNGTRCRDVVRYAVPGGTLVHRLVVRRDVESIFTYREQSLQQILAHRPQAQPA